MVKLLLMYLPRTLIVSDHPFNSESLFALLRTFKSIELVDKVFGYESVEEFYSDSDIDVLLVDVYEDSSLEMVKKLFDKFKRTRIMAITSSTNPWFLSSLIHYGANGCFITNAKAAKLCEAITYLNQNKWYLPDHLHNRLYCEIEDLQTNGTNHHQIAGQNELTMDLDALTNREIEILRLMVRGEQSSQIAEELFISESTVFTHRKHILKKLGFTNTPTLIRCALEQGVI